MTELHHSGYTEYPGKTFKDRLNVKKYYDQFDAVYIDSSGSMGDYYDRWQPLYDILPIPVYAFSTIITAALLHHMGGTDPSKVFTHALQQRHKRILILTDDNDALIALIHKFEVVSRQSLTSRLNVTIVDVTKIPEPAEPAPAPTAPLPYWMNWFAPSFRDIMVAELQQAHKESERAKEVFVTPYSGYDAVAKFHESRGVMLGIGRVIDKWDAHTQKEQVS